MADPGPPEDRLSDGLLLLRADVLLRSRLGALDDRDDVYVLREVAAPDGAHGRPDEPHPAVTLQRHIAPHAGVWGQSAQPAGAADARSGGSRIRRDAASGLA
jgi:hypothetical protein